MQLEFICTKHNFKYGFDRPVNVQAAHLLCPLCAREEIGDLRLKLAESQEHNHLLLQTVDLKKLYQPLKED